VKIEAVFFDLGGVLLRTEYQAPREHLAERLGLSYDDLVRMIFESESARKASLGEITVQQHWEAVAARLRRPASEIPSIRGEFFGGDVLDRELLEFIRGLRQTRRTGLISNGWPDLREYIVRNGFADAFDAIVISAEVGLLKPDARIYQLALQSLRALPQATALVDDMPANVDAARSLGMEGIVFREAGQARQELQRLLA